MKEVAPLDFADVFSEDSCLQSVAAAAAAAVCGCVVAVETHTHSLQPPSSSEGSNGAKQLVQPRKHVAQTHNLQESGEAWTVCCYPVWSTVGQRQTPRWPIVMSRPAVPAAGPRSPSLVCDCLTAWLSYFLGCCFHF